MPYLTLLTAGSLKTSWLLEGCRHYQSRIPGLEVLECKASKQRDPEKQREEECERMLEKLEKVDAEVWVLDEVGKEMRSQEFSKKLEEVSDHGQSVVFVLGGAFGLTQAVRDRADVVLSLSEMTLPHELCRLLFLEQLYRAEEIRRGSKYHH